MGSDLQPPEPPPQEDLRRTGWDTLNAFAFVLGTGLIEVTKRTLFPDGGIPFLAEVVLTIGELTFIVGLLTRFWRAVDLLTGEVYQSRTARILRQVSDEQAKIKAQSNPTLEQPSDPSLQKEDDGNP